MMNPLGKGAALCLIGAVLAAVLKKKTPELALMLSLAVVLLIGTLFLRTVTSALTLIESIMSTGNLPRQLFQPLLKTVGISMISRIAGDLCKDAGESAMATAMESAGAVASVVVALPLFEAVWNMLRSML